MTAPPAVEIIDVGVDYLTVTCKERKRGVRMTDSALSLMRGERRQGEKIMPWFMAGFQGYACGSVQVGNRDFETMVRLSGDAAHDHWTTFYDLSDNCSRVDLQVTARYPRKPQSVIAGSYRAFRRHRRKLKRGSDVTLVSSVDGASTIYLGKRISDRFARVYDKAAESKLDQWQQCVRFEVELKNKAASRTIAGLRAAPDVQVAIKENVAGYLLEKGYSPAWIPNKPASSRWPTILRTREGSLRWLEKSVAPAIRNLIELGMAEEVCTALRSSGIFELPAVHMDQLGQTVTKEEETQWLS